MRHARQYQTNRLNGNIDGVLMYAEPHCFLDIVHIRCQTAVISTFPITRAYDRQKALDKLANPGTFFVILSYFVCGRSSIIKL